MAGVTVPADTKILIGEVTSVDVSEPFAHEKLSPVLALYKAKDFETALQMAEQLVADGGYGHTSSLYVDTAEKEKMAKHAASDEDMPYPCKHTVIPGGIGDLVQLQTCSVSDTWLWFLGWKLCI